MVSNDLIRRAEETLKWTRTSATNRTLAHFVPELIAALKDAQEEARSHQETVMHTQDALSMVQTECRRQLDLNHFAANALQTAQTKDPSQNWQSLIERLQGEKRWIGEMQ